MTPKSGRQRRHDPLASRIAVTTVINQLRERCPGLIPRSYSDLQRLFYAVTHYQKRPEPTTRRGRKSRYKPYQLDKIGRELSILLNCGTPTLSVNSFTRHYLQILTMPDDVVDALESGKINLFEAEQVSRLTERRTGIPENRIKKRRAALLDLHIKSQDPGSRLRERVNALLYHYDHPETYVTTYAAESQQRAALVAEAAKLESELEHHVDCPEIAPDHFFFEYASLINGYLQELNPAALTEKEMDNLMAKADDLIEGLHAAHKRITTPPAEKKQLAF